MHAFLLALVLTTTPQAEPAPAAVVVCPEAFRAALRPWVEYRESQGHEIRIVSNRGTADEVRDRIRSEAKDSDARFVVLVGDAEPGMGTDEAVRERCVPTHHARATINVHFGGKPRLATDNWFADFDDDGLPDVALGRLSVDSADELKKVVAKILAYERNRDFGLWRRQLNFVIGVGRFGPIIDGALDSTARHLLTNNVPDGYRVSVTQANWQSPRCPDPRRFRESTLARLNEGSLFWVYVGHGKSNRLDEVHVPRRRYPIMDINDAGRLQAKRPPIALILACSTGEFDAPKDSLAEQMVRAPGGPVAAVAASRVAMPYAMAIFGAEMIEELFRTRPPTLGEMVLHAKRNSAAERPDDPNRKMFDSIASLISPTGGKLPEERRENVLLFNLLGDPMLWLAYPEDVKLDVPASVKPGESLTVKGRCPVAGQATVELIVARGRLKFTPPDRQRYPGTNAELATMQDVYEQANDNRLTTVKKTIEAGRPFEVELSVPKSAFGPCHVRVFVEGKNSFALGASPVVVQP
ncbi:MAG: hypothetical protein JW818_19655 [Pirellulales bacterium]|nr:hypothetical protein [Pirellulales bacterium]